MWQDFFNVPLSPSESINRYLQITPQDLEGEIFTRCFLLLLDFSMLGGPKENRAKRLGAYYTDERIADFLVRWALRSAQDTVVDPSFGGGVFLEAAARRLKTLGGSVKQVYGVELDEAVHTQVSYELQVLYGFRAKNLVHSDFFKLKPKQLPLLDAVVGNPPFIRYQSFKGDGREAALAKLKAKGVTLNSLASSWAAFAVGSTTLLRQGGRLAFVLPMELGHASYARPVFDYLTRSFERLTLLTFREPLFPELAQDTLLLLAENKTRSEARVKLLDLESLEDLEALSEASLERAQTIDAKAIIAGREKLNFYFLSEDAQRLYKRLMTESSRLGDVANVGIGYVTGANDFFHLSQQEAKSWKLNENVLKPALYKGSAFKGLSFTKQDWQNAEREKSAGFLFYPRNAQLSKAVRAYIEYGEERSKHMTYKCRSRSPWYVVPQVYQADAFLTYMNGLRSQFVVNEASAVAPNTLHLVRLHQDSPLSAKELAVLWQTSLTSLSVELEGHALGGGMLKLEPSEAKNVLLPLLTSTKKLKPLAKKLDTLLRQKQAELAYQIADDVILAELLKLSKPDIETLKESAELLRNRRYYKKLKQSTSFS
jgi:adenine-specific DNA-methyltransferase